MSVGSRRSALLALPALALVIAACGDGAGDTVSPAAPVADGSAGRGSAGSAPPPFVEAESSGLDFVHENGMSGAYYLAEITCGGGALFDADGDGDLDVFLAQGRPLGPAGVGDASRFGNRDSSDSSDSSATDRLFRNDSTARGGDGPREVRFTDVTAASGVGSGDRGYGCAAAAADVDNDGRNDLLVLELGENRLLRNLGPAGGDGDGVPRFAEVTATSGLGGDEALSSVAASFFDYDRDGWLDLFVANNLAFVYDDPPPCFDLAGAPDYCGPGAFAPQPDRLYRNLGLDAEGRVRFADVTAELGLGAAVGPALGAVTADFDGDGWPDIYVANDGQPNNLWLSERDDSGRVRFRDAALLAGAAVNAAGAAEASMGVDAADVDRDGDLDLFLAHLVKETNTLYLNEGAGRFEDRTVTSGLGPPSLPYTAFGAGFLDYDNDGWLDLLVVNGAVTKVPALARAGDPFPLHQPNQLFRNLGPDGRGTVRFADVSATAGPAFARSEVSRGAAFGDLDDDGDTDVVVINNGGPVRLLINRAGDGSGWLGLRLLGSTGERPARDRLGALVTLSRPGVPAQTQRVRTDGSYGVGNDPRLLFGLGRGRPEGVPEDALTIEVRWPEGTRERFADLPRDRYVTLVQGRGETLP